MKSIFKKIVVCLCLLCMICIPLGTLTGCNKADNIQHNIRQDSDNFETYRRVTVINLRSDKVLLTVEGYISIKDSSTNEIAVIINTAPNKYMMHYVYTGPEVVYLVEQMEPSNTDPYHWAIKIFAVTPDIDLG